MIDRAFTPKEVAEARGVGVGKVLGWIRSGQLEAVNVSEGRLRPRWRISPDALAAFDYRRSNRRTIEPVATPRRRRGEVREYV